MFTDEQAERLNQWCNVYGGGEQCVAAAEADGTIQRLLRVECGSPDIDAAAQAIRQRITWIEVCHRRCKQNVEDILGMIGRMQPGDVAGCGEAVAGLAEDLRAMMAQVAAWVDGGIEAAGPQAEVLGERTPAKQWLASCLCKTLTRQLESVTGRAPLPQPQWAMGPGTGKAGAATATEPHIGCH